MKRSILILLTAAVIAPLFSHAAEETMEERKRRITRKYMRARTTITQSEWVVPELSVEDKEVLDSEKFKGPEVGLQRQEPGMMPPPPAPRRPLPSAEDRNWLLAADPESSPADPYADPYADPFAAKELDGSAKTKSDWTKWTPERDSAGAAATQRDSRYDRRGMGSPDQQTDTYGSRQPGAFGSATPGSHSPYGTQSGTQQDSAVRPWGSPAPVTSGGLDLSGQRQ